MEGFVIQLNCDDQWQMPRNHFHESYEILFVLSGECSFFVENSLLHTSRGSLLLLPPAALHRSVHTGEGLYKRYTLNFPESLVRSLSTPQSDLLACFRQGQHLQLDEGETREMSELFARCAHSPVGFGNDLRRRAALVELLIRLVELGGHAEPPPGSVSADFARIEPILAYIDGDLTHDLSLNSLSQRFFISRQHLCRIFKQTTGYSVGEYITTRRIMRARRLLREGVSVQTAGEEAGFGNNAHFIRVFGRICGCSPGQYARQYRSVGAP